MIEKQCVTVVTFFRRRASRVDEVRVYHGRQAFGVDEVRFYQLAVHVSAAGFEPERSFIRADGRPLPEANQHAVVDSWRPVWLVLGLCLACAWRRLGLVLT